MITRKRLAYDVELGMGIAGLASMETLDDSLKDQDCVDKAPARKNGTEDPVKLAKTPSGEIKQEASEEVSNQNKTRIHFINASIIYNLLVYTK